MKRMTAPIVLIGPMGVGKSTIGKKLAHAWQVPFIDTDNLIASENGDITTIFETFGEAHFRALETAVLADALGQAAVIATGGGVVLSETNRQLLDGENVVYLSTDGKHMQNRLQGTKRPLLKNGFADWQKIYNERKDLYRMVARHEIDTSNLPLKAIVSKIEELVGE